MQAFYFFYFSKQRLCIFSQNLSNENKQRLYKIQKRPTSLFYHVLLIKQNECMVKRKSIKLIDKAAGKYFGISENFYP